MVGVEGMIESAERLRDAVDGMVFSEPVTDVYNPLNYAWAAHEMYLRKYGMGPKRVVFLGMNPGPWGMAQTGVPFGEVALVKEWVGVNALVRRPLKENLKRRIEGFNCKRSEVSGRRLWGLFKERFGEASVFFKEHFVANYCPLVFMEETGRNRTPDKLPISEAEALYAVCDQFLREEVQFLSPEWVIGVGGFAERRAEIALKGMDIRIGHILHPSPASPAANKNWGEKATQQLIDLGVWS